MVLLSPVVPSSLNISLGFVLHYSERLNSMPAGKHTSKQLVQTQSQEVLVTGRATCSATSGHFLGLSIMLAVDGF